MQNTGFGHLGFNTEASLHTFFIVVTILVAKQNNLHNRNDSKIHTIWIFNLYFSVGLLKDRKQQTNSITFFAHAKQPSLNDNDVPYNAVHDYFARYYGDSVSTPVWNPETQFRTTLRIECAFLFQ
jgi:hypothetical protein